MFRLGYKYILSLSKFLTAFWTSQNLGKRQIGAKDTFL